MTEYAELHALSAFSFGRGASSAHELFTRAQALGYQALAITDECSMAGVVRALEAARESGVALIVGTELTLEDGLKLVLLAENAAGYTNLCRLITQGRRQAGKGRYRLGREDFPPGMLGVLALWPPDCDPHTGQPAPHAREQGRWVQTIFGKRAWLAVELHRGPDDTARLQALRALAGALGLRCVAAGDVHMHERARRPVQDVLTAIRHHCTLEEAGGLLFPNGERHLRSRRALAAIYPPDLLTETIAIARRCTFDLGQLRYQYPHELVPEGETPTGWLRTLTWQGAAWRWPEGAPTAVAAQIEHELALIAELGYEPFFLTVHDLVRHARSRGILCQGRGSAANSAVCFALGVTEVDPARHALLFERFISRERREPPDIDIDFEHERREEVIQYVYEKYGRERAALAATVICYRAKSAARDVAKVLGLPGDQIGILSRALSWWEGDTPLDDRLREHGIDPDNRLMRRIITLTRALLDMPRHLSQHVGGFVISEQPLHHLVPVENAAMAARTIIQWDKDDLETLGLLKVDCLALGMLTCVSKCLRLLREVRGVTLTPATIPAEDAATYVMIQRADTIGTFQIESRAQMAMLPRLKPACFYDLVIEVAIVRPGPIQGDMVHPYLRRRQGLEPVEYPSPELRAVFERTLGVPLFQEQVMQLAIVGAGFTPGEADQLRRSMAAWKRRGGLEYFRERIVEGMETRGYETSFALQVFAQIKGFGSYGFPESHAASFALITYVSCWLKCHEPAAFTCALLNSQPMGFYGVDQLLQDARRHGVEIRPVDVRCSDWESTLEPRPEEPAGQPAIRLGLQQIRGFPVGAGARLVEARRVCAFRDVQDLCLRAELDAKARRVLADAGALRGLAGHRHRAHWATAGVEAARPLLTAAPEAAVTLPVPSEAENLLADYASLGFTLGRHPLRILRARLQAGRCLSSQALRALAHGTPVRHAGLVTSRQRPSTANGTTFLTLEDEHGMVNVIVWRRLYEQQRRVLLESRLLCVEGRVESADGVQHLVASRLQDLSALLGELDVRARDFH
ncbi:MAG: error-prone DNA polymerase [Gammaproteobacteria bacterium]|nr:error-prone DNA polymerase [Gammaproteobacteria bacterium]